MDTVKRSTRVGFWLVVVGTLLVGGAIATGPTSGCIPAVGRNQSPHIGVFRASEIQHTLGGRTCYVETTYLLGFVGFFLVICGALLWSTTELTNERTLENGP